MACAVLVAATSACGLRSDSSGDSAANAGPLVIGMSLPLSGPVADRSKPGLEGYRYWADEINANGGLLGRQVELKVLDDGFDQETAISGYNRLISQDRVDLILGTFSSVLNLAVAPVAERNKYVYIQPSGGADEVFERNFKYMFFAQPATTRDLPEQFVRLIERMPQAERPKTAAYVQQEDPTPTQAAGIFKKRLGALGVDEVYNATYAPDTSNFDAIANSVKQSAPELVISGAVAGDGVSLIRSFQKVGFSPKMLYQENSPTDPAFPSAIGTANAEGIFTPLAYSTEAKFSGNSGFVSGYTKKFGTAPAEDAANSYTAGQILTAAVTAVGKLDQPAIAEWLHANTVNTIVGPMKWDAAGRSGGSMLLGQFQSGALRVVAPADAATTQNVLHAKPAWQ
jgi:branched-chain amino acid transport system substrate-binding protein